MSDTGEPAPRPRTAAVAALRLPAFRNLVIGRTISMVGNSLAPIALAFAVLDLTGSVRDLGLVVGSRSVANGLFLLFGGVVADRLPRQAIMVVSATLSGLSQAAVATLVLTHSATVALLMTLGVVNGIVAAFSLPASMAVVAQTIPAELLRPGNAINRLGSNAAQILGAALGGVLVATAGPGWGLVVDAVSFGLAAIFFTSVRVPAYRRGRSARENPFRELREGWGEFISRTWLWVVVLGFMFFNMADVALLSVLGPAIADSTFGRGGWGLLLAAHTIGLVIGGLVALRLRVRRLLLVGLVGCFGTSLVGVSLGVYPQLALLIPVAVLAGIGLEQFGVAWEVSMQGHLPPEKLARVYSYDMLGSILAVPLGQVAAGPLALAVGTPAALVACGLICGLAVAAMLAAPAVRRLEHAGAPAVSAPVPAPVPG
jgi:MFS family permease